MYINTETQYKQTFTAGLKSVNALNPSAYYTNRYFRKSAKLSGKTFEKIIDPLVGKIKTVKIKSGRSHIYAWDINPDNSPNYVIFLHGMAQNVSNYQNLYEKIAAKNIGIFSIEYRGYGHNKKAWLSEDGMKKDIKKAFKYLIRQKGIRPQDITVIGHSMGGALAADFAAKNPELKSLILICPITNLNNIGEKFSTNKHLGIGIPKRLLDITKVSRIFNWMNSLRFNSINKIKKTKTPTYIIQSKNDSVTPIGAARRLAKTARRKGILEEFKTFQYGGHKVDSNKVDAVSSFLDKIYS